VRDDSEEYSSSSSCAAANVDMEHRAPPSRRARALRLVSTVRCGRAVARRLAPEERRRRSETVVRPVVRRPHARGVGAPPLRLHRIHLLARMAGVASARTAFAVSSPRRRAAHHRKWHCRSNLIGGCKRRRWEKLGLRCDRGMAIVAHNEESDRRV
jgi:hypothetical protein